MDVVSLYLTNARTLTFIKESLPPLAPNEVLVKTLYGSVSLGTELPLYLGTSRRSKPTLYPLMTGYESYGVVQGVGSDVSEFQIGECVVSFYGHSTHAVVPASKLIRVPNLSPALALLAILSCDVKKGLDKLELEKHEHVLISGAGTIGLLTLFVTRALGLENVDVLEPQANRRDLAVMLGARHVFDSSPALQATYDIGAECSSRNHAFEILQTSLKSNGRICILADGNLEPLVLLPAFHEKELTVVGSSDGVNYQDHATWFYSLPGVEKLRELFDLETTFKNLPTTFETLASGETSAVKALVKYE